MYVQTESAPADRAGEISVSFGILRRGGAIRVKGLCRVVEVDDGTVTGTPGLELQVLNWDESGHPGLVKQYLKWLHFDALSSC